MSSNIPLLSHNYLELIPIYPLSINYPWNIHQYSILTNHTHHHPIIIPRTILKLSNIMTGNGLIYSTYKNYDDWGMVRLWHCFYPHGTWDFSRTSLCLGFEPFFVPRAPLIPDEDLELEQLSSAGDRSGVDRVYPLVNCNITIENHNL